MSIFPLTPQHSNLFSKIFLSTLLAALLKSKKIRLRKLHYLYQNWTQPISTNSGKPKV